MAPHALKTIINNAHVTSKPSGKCGIAESGGGIAKFLLLPSGDHNNQSLLGYQQRQHSNNIITTIHHNRNSVIIATSANTISPQYNSTGRELLCDRRKWNDQFRPRNLTLSAVRISAIQVANILSNYYVDQLEEVLKLDKRVADEDDPMTQQQADLMERMWEQVEWERRFQGIYQKCWTAFYTSQVTTIIMRGLEGMVVANCTASTADMYVIDPFAEAKRKFEHADYVHFGKSKSEVAQEMAVVCLRANALGFLADYIVQQSRLIYLTFWNSDDTTSECSRHRAIEIFWMRSTKLILSRCIGLLASCAGACLGTLLLPPGGYGTLLGSNVGDGIAGATMDALQ
uniref:Uncharacterized protein n=1 Tax=Leptocylindrus danicus TaxID=163516 RepID=A0A7S2KUB4_9STRA